LERWLKRARTEADKVTAAMAERARLKAQRIRDAAQPADESHPYLERKVVQAHGTRINEFGRLRVPMYAPEGGLVNLQFIDNDGRKWFLKGGRAKGCFSRILGNGELIVVCEGFATGASIAEATDARVGVAFSTGNLAEVATMIRRELNNTESYIWRVHEETAAASGLAPALASAAGCRSARALSAAKTLTPSGPTPAIARRHAGSRPIAFVLNRHHDGALR
jgi:phage/plasmid primase-like uncharacterized protein